MPKVSELILVRITLLTWGQFDSRTLVHFCVLWKEDESDHSPRRGLSQGFSEFLRCVLSIFFKKKKVFYSKEGIEIFFYTANVGRVVWIDTELRKPLKIFF